jgi:hypothetical protein
MSVTIDIGSHRQAATSLWSRPGLSSAEERFKGITGTSARLGIEGGACIDLTAMCAGPHPAFLSLFFSNVHLDYRLIYVLCAARRKIVSNGTCSVKYDTWYRIGLSVKVSVHIFCV